MARKKNNTTPQQTTNQSQSPEPLETVNPQIPEPETPENPSPVNPPEEHPQTPEPPVDNPPESDGQTPSTEENEAKPVYAFPTKSRCPRCGVLDTKATSTQGDLQYRQCKRAICRHTYTVKGKKI